MALTTTIQGIHQSDTTIRAAIIEAIDDIRKNPWLLDYIFASLPQDTLTSQEYGDAEVKKAKEWFLSTEIPVFMNYHLQEPVLPCISIMLAESTETEMTLGDVHYEPTEDVTVSELNIKPRPMLGPFTPNYDPDTGIVTLPTGFTTSLLFKNMVLVDTTKNIGYVVTEVTSSNTFTIAEDLNANFTNAIISPIDNFYIAQLESSSFKEVYSIACYVSAEPVQLSYLHSILVFILLRYKEELLEGRGFERSTFSSSDFRRLETMANENIYARYLTLTGYVRQYWPKILSRKIQGITIQDIQVIGGTATPQALLQEVSEQGWVMDADVDALAGIR